MPLCLNHSFLGAIIRQPGQGRAAELVHHVRQRLGTRENVFVHPDLPNTETGDGPFIRWANRNRGDAGLAPLIEILLHTMNGPWVTDLEAHPVGEVQPPIDGLAGWLQETLRRLLGQDPAEMTALVSPSPTGGADAAEYTESPGGRRIANWRIPADVDRSLVAHRPQRTAAQVLEDAAAQVGERFVVLESARRSARAWILDCPAAELHRALLFLPTYARELARRLPDGTRPTREAAAALYHRESGIPMSRESGDVSRQPNRRRQRTFDTGAHGSQFFDMHAKPGGMTRVHVWVHVDMDDPDAPPTIYVGHCGRHLD